MGAQAQLIRYSQVHPVMIVILLGPPGVGKGTQAQMAADKKGWLHLSTGDMLRAQVDADTELGDKAQLYMNRGDLVPDEIMVAMVAEEIQKLRSDQVLLLDGFPRTAAQAEALGERAPGGAIRIALYFSAPKSVLTARLLGRGRKDDSKEVIEHRLDVYDETTQPLVSYYRDQGLLREVDADRTIEAIQTDVLQQVGGALASA